jgi:hypothetical protein
MAWTRWWRNDTSVTRQNSSHHQPRRWEQMFPGTKGKKRMAGFVCEKSKAHPKWLQQRICQMFKAHGSNSFSLFLAYQCPLYDYCIKVTASVTHFSFHRNIANILPKSPPWNQVVLPICIEPKQINKRKRERKWNNAR